VSVDNVNISVCSAVIFSFSKCGGGGYCSLHILCHSSIRHLNLVRWPRIRLGGLISSCPSRHEEARPVRTVLAALSPWFRNLTPHPTWLWLNGHLLVLLSSIKILRGFPLLIVTGGYRAVGLRLDWTFSFCLDIDYGVLVETSYRVACCGAFIQIIRASN